MRSTILKTTTRDNFETSETTAVSTSLYLYQQAVIITEYRPLSLELIAVIEDIVMDNIEVLRKNGFEYSIDKEGNFNYYSTVYYINLLFQPLPLNELNWLVSLLVKTGHLSIR